jgi:hypothetical protein
LGLFVSVRDIEVSCRRDQNRCKEARDEPRRQSVVSSCYAEPIILEQRKDKGERQGTVIEHGEGVVFLYCRIFRGNLKITKAVKATHLQRVVDTFPP